LIVQSHIPYNIPNEIIEGLKQKKRFKGPERNQERILPF